MELNKYDALKKIDMSTYDWNCRVRAQAVWKGMNRDTQEFWGLNILFIDDSNSRIHAYANAKYCDDIMQLLKEGEVYILSNFKVKDFLGDELYRPVRNQKHIYFTKDTKLTKDGEEGLTIEKYAFDLFHMMEIEKLADDNRFLIDMVGIVRNRKMIQSTKDNQEKYRFKFDLVDGRNDVKVTLFDEFGIEFEKAIKGREAEDVIIIISCAKVSRYEGQPYLTNYPATRIYIDPDHYSVDSLKSKLAEKFDISSEEEEESKANLTVGQIKLLGEGSVQQEVSCEVVVDQLEIGNKWYTIHCTNCTNEVNFTGKNYKCTDCNRVIPFPRRSFNVHTLCSDNTGCIAILFPDSVVSNLIDKTVDDLYSPEKEEIGEQPYPELLNQIKKQKYVITLLIKKNNILNPDTEYEVIEISQAMESVANYSPVKQESMVDDIMSISKETKTPTTKYETPQTRRSTSTKSRARKMVEAVPFDVNLSVERNEAKKKAK